MSLTELLASSPAATVSTAGLLGLLVGSFLNVVIFRLPKMMEADWKAASRECLDLPEVVEPQFNLMKPLSRCRGCKTELKPWQNIPVVSWMLLKGKCATCKEPISVQYPVVEAVSAMTSAAIAWRFGWSIHLAFMLLMTWSLIALAVIDLREKILPDAIVQPLLWLGLIAALYTNRIHIDQAVLGAVAGYLLLWIVAKPYEVLRGRTGMGDGDLKLMAAMGAWLGLAMLPQLLVLSAAFSFVLLALMRFKGMKDLQIPFGPGIAVAGFAVAMGFNVIGSIHV